MQPLEATNPVGERYAMKTFSATPKDIEKSWILIDADGLVVGRLAALIASRARLVKLSGFIAVFLR